MLVAGAGSAWVAAGNARGHDRKEVCDAVSDTELVDVDPVRSGSR
jgi:hypothetical protein